MNNSFLTAAASYYGLNPDTVLGDFGNQDGSLVFTFTIMATDDDLSGILSRMKAMREEETQSQRDQPQSIRISSDEELRMEYAAMTPRERSIWGSFARYKVWKMSDDASATSNADTSLNRKVEHINAPEDSETTDMRAVWIPFADATTAQRNYANDSRPSETAGTEYLVQWAMLTEEQKAQAKEHKP